MPRKRLTDLVGFEGAAIWLYRRLKATGAIDSVHPEFRDALRARALDDSVLRLDVEAEAGAVLDLLDHAGMAVILLKGLARCALAPRYPYLDARSTSDVDLLLPLDQLDAADRVLRADGYRPALPPGKEYPDHHHLPPLAKGRITVELHSSTSVRVPAETAWRRANDGGEVVEWGGRRVRVPSATDIAWQAISHAMEDGIHGFRLTRFLEVAALVAGDAPIDWSIVKERSATHEARDPETPASNPQAVVLAWIGAALAFVEPKHRPAGFTESSLDLARLLRWRGWVLSVRQTLGLELTEHLLQEGPRAMLRLPLRCSPANASRLGRLRRPLVAASGRVAFALWQLAD